MPAKVDQGALTDPVTFTAGLDQPIREIGVTAAATFDGCLTDIHVAGGWRSGCPGATTVRLIMALQMDIEMLYH